MGWRKGNDPVAPSHDQGERAEWPQLDKTVIAFLEEAFPARCIRADETVEQAQRYAGKRELVETMRTIYERQHGRG